MPSRWRPARPQRIRRSRRRAHPIAAATCLRSSTGASRPDIPAAAVSIASNGPTTGRPTRVCTASTGSMPRCSSSCRSSARTRCIALRALASSANAGVGSQRAGCAAARSWRQPHPARLPQLALPRSQSAAADGRVPLEGRSLRRHGALHRRRPGRVRDSAIST